jgi:DNA-binding transcriptional ArsR family regulator
MAKRSNRKKAKRNTKGGGSPVQVRATIDNRLVKALSHELRARALSILNERIASPKQLSVLLDAPLSRVNYHVEELLKFECVELVYERPVRGTHEHFYRGTTRSFLSDTNWAQLNPEAKAGISVAGMKMINETAEAAFLGGTFDARLDRHLSCTPGVVDEQGWKDAMEEVDGALERLLEILGESATRLAESNEKGFWTTFSILGFESPPPPPTPTAD